METSKRADPYADCDFEQQLAAGPWYFVEGQDRGLAHVVAVAAYNDQELPCSKSRAEMLADPELRKALDDWESGDRSAVWDYHVFIEEASHLRDAEFAASRGKVVGSEGPFVDENGRKLMRVIFEVDEAEVEG